MKISEALTEVVDLERKLVRMREKRKEIANQTYDERFETDTPKIYEARKNKWEKERLNNFIGANNEISKNIDGIIDLKVRIGKSNVKNNIDKLVKEQAFINSEIKEFQNLSTDRSFLNRNKPQEMDVEDDIRSLEAKKNSINKKIHLLNHSSELV